MRPLGIATWAVAAAWLAACPAEEGRDLSTAELSRVVDAHRPTLEPCYQAALDRNPYKHEIRIQAVIHIEPSGKVGKVELDQGGLAGMGPCIQRTIESWPFPQAEVPTKTELPIIFKPEILKKAQ